MFPYDFKREKFSLFTGRENELRWLDSQLPGFWSSISPIIITGLGGIGKTSLVKYWLSTRTAFKPLWLDISSQTDSDILLNSFVTQLSVLNQEKYPLGERFLVVIDGSDVLSEELHQNVVERIFNYKIVSSLIITKRKPIPLRGSIHLALEPLSQSASSDLLQKLLAKNNINENEFLKAIEATKGHPLAISLISRLLNTEKFTSVLSILNQPLYDLSHNKLIPKTEIITSVSPIIVSANQKLITALKNSPGICIKCILGILKNYLLSY